MGEVIVDLAGTASGELLAIALALVSALAHAVFGAINKGGVDPFLNRGAINASYGLIAAPFALWIVPTPTVDVLLVLCAAFFIHLAYQWFQATAFAKGAFTLVYPIARGTGPLVTAMVVIVVFQESFTWPQWLGLLVLSSSIFSLAAVSFRYVKRSGAHIEGVVGAIVAALATGVMVAAYTTVDAYGIRLAADPFTFLAWFFFLDGFGFPVIAWLRWRRMSVRPALRGLALRGVTGAIVAFISFGAFMLATRLGRVAEAAVLRETSIIFAAAIGVLVFKERIQLPVMVLITLIATGAVVVKLF